MNIPASLTTWKQAVLGVGLDVDKTFGDQCVDVALSWGQTVFPGVAYSTIFPPVPNAKDMFGTANLQFFDRIENNHADVNQLPQPGDVCIFDAVPKGGVKGYTSTFENPAGHTGVVDHADQNYVWLLQQDGSVPGAKTQLVQRSWRYSPCLGWLHPKVANTTSEPTPPMPTGDAKDPRIGKTLFLHPVDQWSVYRVGQQPIRTQRIGYLIPRNYHHGPNGQPGLTYTIVGVSHYPSTVTIDTDSYGRVDIYVDTDGEIL